MKRDAFLQNLPLDLGYELIVDNFAGGGGTSTGLEAAFGRPVDIAINHDPEALAMHALNHPHTLHLVEDVWQVNPLKVTGNRPVGLVWLSPSCTHFSRARGGVPVSKQLRGLAWVGLRWAALCKPRVLAYENVTEMVSWGPVIQNESGHWVPDPKRKGKTFESFVRQLRAMGYQVDWKELRACDSGAPTIRTRLFLLARRDGLPIVWPEQTHADPTDPRVIAGILKPYRSAAECIDFDTPALSIFDRKRPLVENTLKRVAKGVWRHVLATDTPYIVPGAGQHCGVDQAAFIGDQSRPQEARTAAANEPLRTQCAQVKGGHFTLTAAALAPLRGTTPSHIVAQSFRTPLSTVAASGTHHALVGANLAHVACSTVEPQSRARAPRDVLKAAVLVDMGHGERASTGAKRWSHGSRSPRRPLNTVTASGATSALAETDFMRLGYLDQANGGFYDGDGRPLTKPTSTVLSKGANQRLVAAHCLRVDRQSLQPCRTKRQEPGVGVSYAVIARALLTPQQRTRAKKVARFLNRYLPERFPVRADVVVIGDYVLLDITLRMLRPRELYRAQAFPDSYEIDEIPDPAILFKDGVQAADPRAVPRIPLSAAAQVRMCGNSVSPIQAEVLIRSNFAHELLIYGRKAA